MQKRSNHMNAKQRLKAIFTQRPHDRLGWHFDDPHYQDILGVPGPPEHIPGKEQYHTWGHHEELKRLVPHFKGEVRLAPYGYIYGRLNGKTIGECIWGHLQDGWEGLDDYQFPTFDLAEYEKLLMAGHYAESDRYAMTGIGANPFSNFRSVRSLTNALMDTLDEPEYVAEYLNRLLDNFLPALHVMGRAGVDGVLFSDDWGTQISPFISPRSFAQLFQPIYARMADVCHSYGMDLIIHSCGYVYPLMDMMCEAGINGFQFDQPELVGSHVCATEFKNRAGFFCPVDIQSVLSTGDRAYIEKKTLDMCNVFRENGGHLVCKDYPTYGDIGVETDWAKWALDVILKNSDL